MFQSFFMNNLVSTTGKFNFESIRKWTKRVNIFEKKLVIFPCNLKGSDEEQDDKGFHWTLVGYKFLQ